MLKLGGLVIIGQCNKCDLAIWGKEGEQKDRHSLCGIVKAKK